MEELKETTIRKAVVVEKRVAMEERRMAIEERKIAMEESEKAIENECKLMFMDTSGMSEKQKRYVELCRDELLKKKELALDSMRGSMGSFGAMMGGYMPPYGGGGFMGGGGGGFMGGGV
jgi:hypothetical protein